VPFSAPSVGDETSLGGGGEEGERGRLVAWESSGGGVAWGLITVDWTTMEDLEPLGLEYEGEAEYMIAERLCLMR
jgi:hypothetical protein